MKWTTEAEEEIRKVPFFVRKKVRQRVEKEAGEAGKQIVDPAFLNASRQRFISGMASEIKGFQLDVCFGPGGCKKRAADSQTLMKRLETVLNDADILGFLKQQVKGDLKFHHEFRVSLAECPNACSQPQIKDIGIIGARLPETTSEPCTKCKDCVQVCPDSAIRLDDGEAFPEINETRCSACGLCIDACATRTINEARRGYRIMLAGKLGRHPRLATELPGVFTEDDVVKIVSRCIDLYKQRSKNGRRFADIFTPDDAAAITATL
jgi:anaerobic sulfite reductase subunit C